MFYLWKQLSIELSLLLHIVLHQLISLCLQASSHYASFAFCMLTITLSQHGLLLKSKPSAGSVFHRGMPVCRSIASFESAAQMKLWKLDILCMTCETKWKFGQDVKQSACNCGSLCNTRLDPGLGGRKFRAFQCYGCLVSHTRIYSTTNTQA